MSFAYLRYNLVRFVKSLNKPNRTWFNEVEETDFEHFLGVFTPLSDVTRFIEQFIVFVCRGFVQRTDQFTLQLIFDVINQEMHDRFGNGVLNVFAHDEKIRTDQFLCNEGK
jgi:hypothetical protein